MKASLIKKVVLSAVVTLTPLLAFGQQEEVYGYDSIVEELRSGSSSSYKMGNPDPFASVLIHGGVALTSSYLSLSTPDSKPVFGMLRGFEASFGIDLLSRNWLAEGAVRSFGNDNLDKNHQASLKEFDLKVVYKSSFSRLLRMRVGAGIAARYLTFKRVESGKYIDTKYTTPSSILFVGLEAPLSRRFSIGSDLSLRSAMIDETIDRSTVDASVRLDAHF